MSSGISPSKFLQNQLAILREFLDRAETIARGTPHSFNDIQRSGQASYFTVAKSVGLSSRRIASHSPSQGAYPEKSKFPRVWARVFFSNSNVPWADSLRMVMIRSVPFSAE